MQFAAGKIVANYYINNRKQNKKRWVNRGGAIGLPGFSKNQLGAS